MSELVDELDSANELAELEARKLLAKDPKHELLKYFVLSEEDMTDGEPDLAKYAARREEMKNRFWGQKEPWQNESNALVWTTVLTNYYHALKEVNARQEVAPETTTSSLCPTCGADLIQEDGGSGFYCSEGCLV